MGGVIAKALKGASEVAVPWAMQAHRGNIQEKRDTKLAEISKNNTLSAETRTNAEWDRREDIKSKSATASASAKEKRLIMHDAFKAELKRQGEAGDIPNPKTVWDDIIKEFSGKGPKASMPKPEELDTDDNPGFFKSLFDAAKDLGATAASVADDATRVKGKAPVKKGPKSVTDYKTGAEVPISGNVYDPLAETPKDKPVSSKDLPKVNTQADYDALETGDWYWNVKLEKRVRKA